MATKNSLAKAVDLISPPDPALAAAPTVKQNWFMERAERVEAHIIKNLEVLWLYRTFIALVFGVPLLVILLLLAAYMLFFPQSIHYDFASQNNCAGSPVIFPSIFKTDSTNAFKLSRVPTVSIGHTPLFSYHLCAKPLYSPLGGTSYTEHQWVAVGGWRPGKSIKIVTSAYPKASAINLGTQAIPIQKPLVFTLSQPDATFSYALVANGQTSICSALGTQLSCELNPLKLDYDATYHVSLARLFNGQVVGTALSKSFKTITATAITHTSVHQGALVYDKPQQITINTDKNIVGLQSVSLTTKNAAGVSTVVPATSSFSGKTITVTIKDPLLRRTVFDLRIANITASDKSTLEQPYDLVFTTSGGPAVTGVDIPSYGLSSGQTIAVSFDQPVDPNQDPGQFASLLVNGVKQSAAISLSGQQLIIKPGSDFPVCATVSVQLTAAAQSAYGISGDSAWTYNSRAHCYTTYSIGTSVQGRPMTAYQFGSGPSMVLYVGAMEGNEKNSMALLQKWIPELDANPGKIPSYRTIVVIPAINPDGVAANSRLNANGIDLNRNFPANNWQTQVTEPLANTVWTNDGGPNPLSEPESQALANFQVAHNPRLSLTMHSHGGIVEANDAGDSIDLGAKYASLAGYLAIPTYSIGNFFNYTTTGAYEDWANDKLGQPVLEVELISPTADEFSRNLPALWAMAQVSQ